MMSPCILYASVHIAGKPPPGLPGMLEKQHSRHGSAARVCMRVPCPPSLPTRGASEDWHAWAKEHEEDVLLGKLA